MLANADFSTPLKCLASGKKSIEQLHPSAPQQTSALELLVVYCFCILLVYPCALYYEMLIYHVRMELVLPPSLPGTYLSYIHGKSQLAFVTLILHVDIILLVPPFPSHLLGCSIPCLSHHLLPQ